MYACVYACVCIFPLRFNPLYLLLLLIVHPSSSLAQDVAVVACPCALGLAAPTAILVASSYAPAQGLIVRGGDVFEAAEKVDTVLLDKTGTLTQAAMRLCDVRTAGWGRMEVLATAAAAEVSSSHPIAKAISAAMRESESAGEKAEGQGIRLCL